MTIVWSFLSQYLVGSEKGRLWKTTSYLLKTSQFCDIVSFVVGVVVVRVAHTLYGGQFQTQIVAENTVVASFGILVAFLDRAKRLVEQNNLVT